MSPAKCMTHRLEPFMNTSWPIPRRQLMKEYHCSTSGCRRRVEDKTQLGKADQQDAGVSALLEPSHFAHMVE
eukprot:6178348-Amphidinium_carterae.1